MIHAEGLRNRSGCARVVAGQHHRANAELLQLADCVACVRARLVPQRQKPDQPVRPEDRDDGLALVLKRHSGLARGIVEHTRCLGKAR